MSIKYSCFLFAVNDFLSDIPLGDIKRFESEFLSYIDEKEYNLVQSLKDEKKFTDKLKEELEEAINTFKKSFEKTA